MANPAHLEKLCQGPKAWNAWREANPNVVPDLSEIQLSLNQRQLGPSNGGPIDLHAVNLEGAVLRYATLSAADLQGARLNAADLMHARLDGANLMGADLTDALLDQADLGGAGLDQAVLFGADLTNVRNLSAAQLEPAYGDVSTRLPSNLQPPQSWLPATSAENLDEYSGWGMAGYQEPVQQNLYAMLGLTPAAQGEDIRSAYRNLVKKLHPDLNPNDQDAQERFNSVTIAYRILSDPEQRGRYDRSEIDAEGRVNPEFEAKRQFRRTAYRYYAAAAVSFLFAAGVLAAVWHTVLSRDPAQEVVPQQAAASQPKRSERLGGDPSVLARPSTVERNAALFTEGSETVQPDLPTRRSLSPPPIEAAKADFSADKPSLEAPATDGSARVSVAPDPPPPAAVPSTPSASEPSPASPQEQSAAALEDQAAAPPDVASQTASGSEQANPVTRPEVPAPVEAAAEHPPAKALSPAPQAGTTPRPLREIHKSASGQTTPSAPDRWTVAAIPQANPQDQTKPERQRQPFAYSREQPAAMPEMARRQPAQDMVSKVLRNRAIRQALGTRTGRPVPGRREGATADFPTNALPNKPRAAAVKQTAPSQPKTPVVKTVQGPDPTGNATAPAATAQPAPRAAREHQAVSDIFAGGM